MIYNPVHPRACGEHFTRQGHWCTQSGSSPRLRGTSIYLMMLAGLRRFIPALAGNMLTTASAIAAISVHPRACGEHAVFRWVPMIYPGSSPRLRGTCGNTTHCISNPRFIPALAGNMPALIAPQIVGAVHPRACGEHLGSNARHHSNNGSSPRLRGT